MELIIEEIRETKEGIEVYGLIRPPTRDDVPRFLNGETTAERAIQLARWTDDSKEANKKYTKEICAYRRVHLGLVILKQEDIEE
jgi:hypothetical protein